MATSGFPRCSDGDVEIHLSTDPKDTFVLHSFQLSLHSPWFKASLSERWNGGDVASSSVFGGRDGGRDSSKPHWVYELRSEKDSSDGTLLRKGATTDLVMEPAANEAISAEIFECVQAHKVLFGAIYHIKPRLPEESLEKAKTSILQLADVASMYGCSNIIEPYVDSHLSIIWRDETLAMCEKDPVGMLSLATRIKSDWIFMEAATHLLGTSNDVFSAAHPKLNELQVANLFCQKRAGFVEKLLKCEHEMFSVQPAEDDTYCHIAIDCFCYVLRRSLVENALGSSLGRNYASLYHAIKAPNDYASLYHVTNARNRNRDAIFRPSLGVYLKRVSRKNAKDNQAVMAELDRVLLRAKVILKPILKDASCKGTLCSSTPGLLFMTVAAEELPWAKK